MILWMATHWQIVKILPPLPPHSAEESSVGVVVLCGHDAIRDCNFRAVLISAVNESIYDRMHVSVACRG